MSEATEVKAEVKAPVITKKALAITGASWLITIVSILFAILKGGTVSFEVPCQNGGKCTLVIDQSVGALDLIDDCKFSKLGDSCKASLGVTAVYSQEGTAVAEPVKPEVKAAEPVKVEAPVEPAKIEAPAPAEPVKAETPAEPAKIEPAPEKKEEVK